MPPLWVALLALHQVYSLAPVISVELGEPVTFACSLPTTVLSSRQVGWYRQKAGDTLKLIVTHQVFKKPEFTPEFNNPRFKANEDTNFVNLTIVRTTEEDEGLYHCSVMEWASHPVWSGTYLLIKGNYGKTSNYEVVQPPTVSGPHRPRDPVTLQCSLLSDSENQTCPGDHSVFWFRVGSDTSHADVIYTDGNKLDKCDKSSDYPRSCVYHFTKNVSSSDSGTHYCAVATCGQILFGNGTKLDVQEQTASCEQQLLPLVISVVCLFISLIGNILLMCRQTQSQGNGQCKVETKIASSEGRCENSSQPVLDVTEDGLDQNYADIHFSGRNVSGGRRKRELKPEESLYAEVQCKM